MSVEGKRSPYIDLVMGIQMGGEKCNCKERSRMLSNGKALWFIKEG
jgi:hypothetical protein